LAGLASPRPADASPSHSKLRNGSRRAKTRFSSKTTQTDDAGHILGNVLGGQGGKGNVFPQLPAVNRGEYRVFEKSVRDYISQHGSVDIEWTFKYANGGLRPTGVQYDVYQNSTKVLGDFFRNI
ncbi:DNA/RNA non-specific endonuclease, partial [Pectobacterium brasiliense]|uniref:DNA/RNA non-specific endonuclease n=1 Tax=Pectobacterium brasiliense TaxID=180957 RepID=UPI0019696796